MPAAPPLYVTQAVVYHALSDKIWPFSSHVATFIVCWLEQGLLQHPLFREGIGGPSIWYTTPAHVAALLDRQADGLMVVWPWNISLSYQINKDLAYMYFLLVGSDNKWSLIRENISAFLRWFSHKRKSSQECSVCHGVMQSFLISIGSNAFLYT